MESKKKLSVPFIDICAYVECSNNRQEVSLYCFPKKSNPLCAEWLARICNPALKYYSSSTLRRMGVCEEHFTPEMFKPTLGSYLNRRKKLKRNAIPEPSDHLVEKWKQKLKEFMAARQIKREHNIEVKEEAEGEKRRKEEEKHQQQRKKSGKEEQQQQRKKSEKEEQQQQRKKSEKEEQQQQRKELEKGEQQQKEPGKEEQQQQRKEPEKEEQRQERKKPGIEEQQQQQQETEQEQQQQQWQEMGVVEWQEAGNEVEIVAEIETEMCVNKPTRVYTKQPFSFSDDEDDRMEWAEDEPIPNCVALDESPLKKTPSEMKLERENVKLKRENKYLKIQLKYLKRKLKRSIISRDRLSNELRKISK